MFDRKDLIKSKEYWLTRIQSKLYSLVEKYINEEGLTRKTFAEKIGVSKGYISQVLNGNFDHRISTFIELSLAIGKVPQIYFEDVDQVMKDDEFGLLDEDGVTDRPVINLHMNFTPNYQTIDSSQKKRMKRNGSEPKNGYHVFQFKNPKSNLETVNI